MDTDRQEQPCSIVVGCGHGRIADPEATKPDDWDEDAAMEVPDEDAKKPEGWLEDEEAEVDDSGARPPGCERAPLAGSLPCLAGAWRRAGSAAVLSGGVCRALPQLAAVDLSDFAPVCLPSARTQGSWHNCCSPR